MSDTAVSCYLGVDVATLAFVEVNLGLKNVDLLCLHLQLLLEVLLHVTALLLFGVVVIHEDGLVGRVEFLIQRKLQLTLVSDHVKEVGVLLDAVGELALDLLEFSLFLFNVADALLFSLLVLDLFVEDGLTWTGYLQ